MRSQAAAEGSKTTRSRLAAILSLLLGLPAAAAEQSFDATLNGIRQRVLYAAPPHPLATIVMLPGGSGEVGLEPDGGIRHDDNFVVRTRAAWVAAGYAVLIPDTFDQTDLRGLRSSPQYARIVDALVELARARSPAPVFLLGTSQGSIAAMNGAAHARPGALAGVVLTESVSRLGGSGETVFSAEPQDVRVPVLIVANRDDRCDVAPAEDAARIAASLTRADDVRVLAVAGGLYRSDRPCGSLTPHGYEGIERPVIDAICRWMRTKATGSALDPAKGSHR